MDELKALRALAKALGAGRLNEAELNALLDRQAERVGGHREFARLSERE